MCSVSKKRSSWFGGLGILNAAQVQNIIAFVTEEENKLGKSFNRFTDLSLIDAVDLTFDYVFQVALTAGFLGVRVRSLSPPFLSPRRRFHTT